MSYRQLANRSVNYLGRLRDQSIEEQHVLTKIRRPFAENQMNYYGDYIHDYLPEEDIAVVPQYNKYYQVIDILGYCVEPELPLEVLLKRYEYVPNNSLIKLGVRNLAGTIQERWWQVQSTEVKHIENVYARVAKLSPLRDVVAVQASISINATSTIVMGNDP